MHLPNKEITRTEVEDAAKELGLSDDVDTLTPEQVKEAYRKILFSTHPDTSGLTDEQAAAVIFNARKAKDLLGVWIALRPDAKCSFCNGSGRVRQGMWTTRPCPKCQG